MACIFISYSSKSKNLVQSLVQDLEMTGHEIWFDHKLTGGQAWWDQILEQIRQCDVFIFALTPDAMDSYPCKLEYTYAHELGKNVLPVLLADGVSVNLLPAALTTIQFVDYRGEDKQAAFRLVNALNALPAPRPLPDSLPTPPPVPISYIGNLKDQIDAPVTLSFDEQASLVFKIKEHLQEPDNRDDAIALLSQLRRRDDLYAKIGEEIDSLLKNATAAPQPARAPISNPAQAPAPETFQVSKTVTTPARQRVVVTPPKSAAATEDKPWDTWLVILIAIGTFFFFPIGLVAGIAGLRSPAKRNQGIGLLVFTGILFLIYVFTILPDLTYLYS